MILTKKIALSISVLIIIGTACISLSFWFFISHQFKATEMQYAEKDMTRVLGAIKREIEALDTYCKDYAFWNDSYNFMQNYNPAYIDENFNPIYLKTQNIHLVSHVNLKGEIIYIAVYNSENYKPIELEELKVKNSLLKSIISMSGGLKEEKGIVLTSGGLMFISSHPVSDNYMKAPPHGKIIMGRFFSKYEINKIASMLKVNLEVNKSDAGTYITDVTEKLKKNKQEFLTIPDNNTIYVYSMLKDLNGNDVAVACLSHNRDINAVGINTVRFYWFLMAGLCLILIGSIIFFLRKSILNPITTLTQRASEISGSNDFEKRLPSGGGDEFTVLADSFNKILDLLVEANSTLEKKIVERTIALTNVNQELLLMHQIFEHSLEGIIITNADAEILSVNPAFSNITGYDPDEVKGKNPRLLKSDLHDDDYFDRMWKSISSTGHWADEIWNRHKDGKAYPEWLSISAIKNSNGNVSHYVGIFHDISDIKRQEELIKYQAYHDALTGLPNRILLKSRIDKAVAHASRNKRRFAIIFLDLDNFKLINDSLGHATGDLLLKEASDKLRRLARTDDTVARLGGDEFIILVEDIADEKPAVVLSQRIISSFKEPFTIKNHNLHVGASIGIAMYPEDGEESDSLIKNADAAMYRAKDEGRQTFALFMPSLNESVARKLKIENELRKAISETNFEVYYQPKMEIKTGNITGMEGLVRWTHPNGIINPGDFIPLAEEIGLISEIDRIVMHKALKEVGELINSGIVSLKLALNCSAKSLHYKGLPDIISSALAKYNFKPEWFELEITETSIMRDIASSKLILYMLLETGISISLDDFGTGYSSLAQLKNLPLHSIKIDRSFIWELEKNTNDANITESIIAMSRRIGVEVVAEGVEKEQQLEFLRKKGCDIAQGFLISPPVPMREFKAFIGFSN